MSIGFERYSQHDNNRIDRVISILSPNRLAFTTNSADPRRNFDVPHVQQLSNLHTYSVDGYSRLAIFEWLSQVPSLRTVELSGYALNVDDSWMREVPQVTRVMVTKPRAGRDEPFPFPLAVLRFFPSAAIVKLDLLCLHETEYESIRSILTQLTPALRILRLEVRLRGGYVSTEPIDDLLPLFPFLRELHLGDRFLSNDIHEHLLVLHHLVELSLVLEDMSPEFVHLLKGPQRLRHLQKLVLQFVPLKPGDCLDIDYAAMEMEHNHCDEDGKGVMLLRMCDEVSDMFYWKLPFGLEFEYGMDVAVKVEKIARKVGIMVTTNLDTVRQGFRRHLVEFFSRGIGHYYFYGCTWRIEEAQAMAKSYQLDLPTLEIDLKEEIGREKLDWFKVRMQEVEVDGKGECYALNLRRKKE